MGALTLLDGGLATALQARGLPPSTPVHGWLLEHPEQVVAAHAAFVDAGARVLLAGTFLAVPGVCADWEALCAAAVGAALQAAAGRATVRASIGPVGEPAAAALLARRAVSLGAEGVVLETFLDPDAALAALGEVRRVVDGPVVVSLTPGPDGRLRDGREPEPALAALRGAGADAVGFNCGPGPGPVLAAVARTDRDGLWLKPAGDGTPATVDALCALAPRARWLGGCCGVDPATIAAARERLLPALRPDPR